MSVLLEGDKTTKIKVYPVVIELVAEGISNLAAFRITRPRRALTIGDLSSIEREA